MKEEVGEVEEREEQRMPTYIPTPLAPLYVPTPIGNFYHCIGTKGRISCYPASNVNRLYLFKH